MVDGYWDWQWQPVLPATNDIVALAAGGGEHKYYSLLKHNGAAVLRIPHGQDIRDVVDVETGTDHAVALLRNPQAPPPLLRVKQARIGNNVVIEASGIIGEIPVVLETSTASGQWNPLQTNWPRSTVWELETQVDSADRARLFRLRRY